MWNVEITDEFETWWHGLSRGVQDAIESAVAALEEDGPDLGRPTVDTLKGSKHRNMKELRVQQAGKPWRVFFAFDPRRSAIILIGGCKAGDKRFYDKMIPIADRLFDIHLEELRKEGLL